MNYRILKQPVISEKSIGLANRENTYTFIVELKANKNQIKEAIEQLFAVEVIRVNTTTRAAEVKQTGRRRLPKKLSKVKKAMVTLKEGDTIELFDTYRE